MSWNALFSCFIDLKLKSIKFEQIGDLQTVLKGSRDSEEPRET